MVSQTQAGRRLVERAAAGGKQVHAWTVNDPDALPRLLDARVANIITDDPGVMRRRLQEIRALSVPERMLLRAYTALAD